MSDDWDDDIVPPTTKTFSSSSSGGAFSSNGFNSGGGFTDHLGSSGVATKLRGFGRGRARTPNQESGFGAVNGFGGGGNDSLRGMGRGKKAGGYGDTSNNSGGSFGGRGSGSFGGGGSVGGFGDGGSGGGFGGGSSVGGFGRPASSNEGFGDVSTSGGGFGRGGSGGGFGSGGFGGDDADAPRGGGFGGGRQGGGGNRTCFKCGEEGHMSRECPKTGGGGGGGSRACFKCGEEGHMSRECPQGGGGGGGGSRACYKCGEEGHMSRECPQSGGGGGGFGDGGTKSSGGRGCHNCGEEGHFSRECPNKEPRPEGEKPREIYVPPPPPEEEEQIFKQAMLTGINFNKYDDIPVECTGNNKPKSGVASFTAMPLNQMLKQNVARAKYERPTPIQKWAIPSVLSGRDIMACAQTGSGKTAAFLLPVLNGMLEETVTGSPFSEIQEPQAIIVGPTRELVLQTYNEARKFAYDTMIRPVVVYGGTSVGYQASQVARGAHLVVGTPGRLLDFIGKGKIGLKKVRYMVLDEADRMLDMGFLPDIRRLMEQMGMPDKTERQTLMFSATFPDEIQHLARDFLNDYLFFAVGRVGGANTDIEQSVLHVSTYDKRDKLVSILNETGTDRTLVFVKEKRQADYLASFLSQSEFPTTSIHGDRLQREREEALRDFTAGRAPILVATAVAARGLDIPDVKHVINFDMPSEIDEYVHRIGRTGRCGNLGKATSFFNPDSDGALARGLVKKLEEAQQMVPSFLEEAAESNLGTGGFTGGPGRFGGRDTRRGKFGGRQDGDEGFGGGDSGSGFGDGGGARFGGSGGGFGGSGGGSCGGADEEAWD